MTGRTSSARPGHTSRPPAPAGGLLFRASSAVHPAFGTVCPVRLDRGGRM